MKRSLSDDDTVGAVDSRESATLRAALGAHEVDARSAPAPESTDSARVLIADDDRVTAELVAAALRESGYAVETAPDGDTALERVARGGIDVVLAAARMPRLGGGDTCRAIRGLPGDFVPVVLMFAKTDLESRVSALQAGVDGCLCKPIEQTELLVTIAAALRLRRTHARMRAAALALERLKTYDELTGAHSFSQLHDRLDAEFVRSERLTEPLACCLVDVDGLKVQNERGGRRLGDAVLRGVVGTAKAAVRESDLVARYGEDEFFVMLPATHFAGALVVASRIWREMGAATFAAPETTPHEARVTVSVGVALFPSRDIRTKEALVRGLEAALLEAKRSGGDRICVFQQDGFIYTPSGEPAR